MDRFVVRIVFESGDALESYRLDDTQKPTDMPFHAYGVYENLDDGMQRWAMDFAREEDAVAYAQNLNKGTP